MINLNFFKKNSEKISEKKVINVDNRILLRDIKVLMAEIDRLRILKDRSKSDEEKNNILFSIKIELNKIRDIKKKIEINNSLKNKE